MTLQDLQAEVQGYREQAGELNEEFNATHARVANDANLSTQGKREQLDELHQELTEQVRALHAREKAAVKSAKETIERRIFGLSPSASRDPARVVSFRDAQSRARQLTDGAEAADIYQSALRSGDNILATAVLERALIAGWSSIKEDYLQRNTSARADLDDLAALAKYSDNNLANLVHYVTPSVTVPHPSGFNGPKPLNSMRATEGTRPLRELFGTNQ